MKKRRARIKCFYCQGEFLAGRMTKDHFIPQAIAVINAGNLVPACRPCNEIKADRLPTAREIERFEKWYGHHPGHDRGRELLVHAMGPTVKRTVSPAPRSTQARLRIENRILAAKCKVFKLIDEMALAAAF